MAAKPYRIASMQLVPTEDQSLWLRNHLGQPRSKPTSSLPWLKCRKLSHTLSLLEVLTENVRITVDAIELPDGHRLMFTRDWILKGFSLAKDRMFLALRPNGWSVEIWFAPRPKTKKQERIHNDAAIFVTEKSGHCVWSGGLPSLGKRR